MEYKEFKPIIIATIVMIAITLSLTMTGCVAPDGTWEFDGTVKHVDDEVVPSPTPEVVYVTQTPEVVYVTVTPEPEPEPTPTPDMAGEDIELENLIPIYNLPGIFEMIDLEIHDGLVVGTYTVEGETYHVYVGVIRYTSSVSPAIFVEEYKNKPEFENSPSQTVSRFSTVTFNGHEATEVRTVSPTGDIRYGYVWSMDRYVYFLKPGASDRSASLELARMIGIPGSASVPTSQTTPAPIHTPAVCETPPPLEVSSGGCDGLDQDVLRRYDFDNSGLIDSNEIEAAKTGYDNNYEKPYDYAQILYAYEHSCPVWSFVCNDGELRGGTVCPGGQVIYTDYCDHNVWVPTGDTCPEPESTPTPTVQPTPAPTPEPTFDDPVIVIDPPIYSGVVRNNGEILDIRITPDPPIAGDDATVEVDVLNTGTVESCYELHWHAAPSGVYEEEAWIYAGDMETFTYTSRIRNPGGRTWTFKLYWDAEWPASNVLLQTATVDVHCYTQYEVDNM